MVYKQFVEIRCLSKFSLINSLNNENKLFSSLSFFDVTQFFKMEKVTSGCSVCHAVNGHDFFDCDGFCGLLYKLLEDFCLPLSQIS
jgi:hypothetical protein